MKRLIVTGAGGSAACNFIDSLRLTQERMFIVGVDINKYYILIPKVNSRYIVPRSQDPKYISKLNEIIAKEKIYFLHPQPDIDVKVISNLREKLDAQVFLPAKKVVEICQDKFKSNEIWRKKGVPTAESHLIRSEKDIEKIFEILNTPIWLRIVSGAGGRGSLPVDEIEHAKMWINYWKKKKGIGYGFFMASEYLPGSNFAWSSIWKDGELVTSQGRERIELLMADVAASGATSTPSVARTVNRDDLNKIGENAILAIDSNPNGVYSVDIKGDKKGRLCVTEINAGRFFTTASIFFAKGGINLPYLYVKLAYQERIPRIKRYNPLPEDLYWIRVIDQLPVLKKKKEI
jgi:carbamoyl-phosphate synthase large subunit